MVGELQTFTAYAGDTQYLYDQDSEGLLSDSNDYMLHLIPALGAPLGLLSIFTFSPNILPFIFQEMLHFPQTMSGSQLSGDEIHLANTGHWHQLNSC